MLRIRTTALVLALTAGAAAVAAVRPALLTSPFGQEMPEPTEQHELLMKGVGEWEGVLTMNYPGVPAEPMEVTDSVVAIGQFWTQSQFKGNFMGMPFHGTGLQGYDVNAKKFVGTWVDNMTTSLSVMEGEYDAETNSLTMRWEAPDMTGETVPHRSVAVHRADAYVMTFYQGEGEGTQTMQIKMKRKAGAAKEAGAVKKAAKEAVKDATGGGR